MYRHASGRTAASRLSAGVAGLVLGLALVMAVAPSRASAEAPECGPSPAATFFADPVPQPPVAAPDSPNHYTLTATYTTHKFASAWPAVPSLGYRTATAVASYLGPTIVTAEGQPIDVTLVNGLPQGKRLFPFDQPTDGNTIVMHRHGGLQPADSDGVPGQEIGPGGSRTNHYPNNQDAAPLWYHDHADHVTSYRVYEGLAGFMPNTDARESKLNLPKGDFAKAYVLQDKSFNADHTLCYTHANPEFFGDLPVVNGVVAPFQAVEPRRYTFTFINGSDSRFFHLALKQTAGSPSAPPALTVLGSDQGYLFEPTGVHDLLIAPGERYTLVADFTGHASQTWVLGNDAATPFPDGDPDIDRIPRLMSFTVGATVSSPDTSSIPNRIQESNNNPGSLRSAIAHAILRTVQAGESEPGVAQLGDVAALRQFTDPVTETPQVGSTEAWAIRNHSPDSHPIHLHLVGLRLIGRWHVGQWDAHGRPVPSSIGAFQPAAAYESGPKDTFVSPTDAITVWVGEFTIAGGSVWHCHILSHEDATVEMMRPLAVGTTPQNLPRVKSPKNLDTLIRQP